MKKGRAAQRERFLQYLNDESHNVRLNSSVHIRRLTDNQLLLLQMGSSFRLSLDPEIWTPGILTDFLSCLREGASLRKLREFLPSCESEDVEDSLTRFLISLFEMKLLAWNDPEAQSFKADLSNEWSDLLSHFVGSDLRMKPVRLRLLGRDKSPRMAEFVTSEIFEMPGIELVETGDADLILVLSSEDHLDMLSQLNHVYHAKSQPWMALIEDAFGGVLTPLFGQKGDPCFECYRLRIEANSRVLGSDINLPSEGRGKSIPLIQRQLAGRVALEVFKNASGFMDCRLNRGAFFFDVLNQRTEFHEVFPSSNCTLCRGGFAASEPALYSFLIGDGDEPV